MGRKKITNLFPDYIRTGKADLEVLSQLVLSAKGERSMNDFANECGVNTSTISRIINMKNTTACSDEVLVAISKAADPNSGVTLEKLLAANGMVKLVPAGTEGAVVSPSQIVFGLADIAEEQNIEPDPNSSDMFLRNVAKTLTGYKLEQNYRETLQNAFLMNGYFVELVSYENMIWPRTKQYRADFAIRTNALLEEGIDTWLFECKSYTAGIGRGTISKMNQLFAMAYMESPRKLGIKVSVVVNHVAMIEQAREYYAGCRIRDYFSFILIDPANRCVKDEFCIPRIDGTEKSVFKVQDGK